MPEGRTGGSGNHGDGGLLGKFIVGIATSVFAAYIIFHYITKPYEQKRSEQDHQQKQADAAKQQKFEQDKIRTEQRVLVVQSIEVHDEQNRKLAEDLKGKYFTLAFRNTCIFKGLELAVRYEELDGSIYVKGWVHLDPQKRITLECHTKKPWFDFYTNPGGEKLEGAERVTISTPNNFEYIENSSYSNNGLIPLEVQEEVKFKSVDITQTGYGPVTFDLPCPRLRITPGQLDQFLHPPKKP